MFQENTAIPQDAEGLVDHGAVAAEVAQPVPIHGIVAKEAGDPAGIVTSFSPGDAGDIPGWLECPIVGALLRRPHAVQEQVVELRVASNQAMERCNAGAGGDEEVGTAWPLG